MNSPPFDDGCLSSLPPGPEITVRPRHVPGAKPGDGIWELNAVCIENDPVRQPDAGRKVLA